jgi:hypothetical protein
MVWDDRVTDRVEAEEITLEIEARHTSRLDNE